MKKMMIVIAVVMGAITSIGVLRAMNNAGYSKETYGGSAQNEQHHEVPPQEFAKQSSGASPENASAREDSSAIEGHVTDSQGNPVVGIEVVADNGGPSAGPLPKAWTDNRGHFLIRLMLAGTYRVYALHRQDNSSPLSLFDSAGITPPHVLTVNVLDGQAATIALEVPPKSSKLVGRVVDAQTNEAVIESRITFRRVDNPDYFLQTGVGEEGNFSISVPPVAITMEVSSPAHETWNYSREGRSVGPARLDSLKLKQGESRRLEVRLRRKAL